MVQEVRTPRSTSSLPWCLVVILKIISWPQGPDAEHLLTLLVDILGLPLFWLTLAALKVKVLIDRSCPTLCDPIDGSLPGSSVHGISQARILELGCHSLLQRIFLDSGGVYIGRIGDLGEITAWLQRE